ncbi:hypothetical protein POM88_046535 [Heracleum sosnowskyi]|uniref:Uncharacterized protein n=1 Tax=Heracleum sosnowskyi TaxID=360622 RepID=A0AAD8H807_9APIA|nr:hypothetical protein POM88_046535 [Heracleum sosnowskyi]
MEWDGVTWRMPRRGYVKVNVHGHYQDLPFANGNVSAGTQIFQQINQRKANINLSLRINPIDEDTNAMAIYLAQHGVVNYDLMVVITNLFGRIFELWSNNMGLGPVEEQFLGVNEEDVNMDAANDKVINEQLEDEAIPA